MLNLSNKVKRVISYGISAIAYAALAISAALGLDLGWWQPVTAIVGFIATTFGVETVIPERKPSNQTGGSS